mgnify:CR=1 FL=1
MAWTLPDKGEGVNDIQSILFQEHLDVLVAGLSGIDCVLSGCAITGGADMTPAVAKGAVLSNRVLFAVAAADVTITAADATNPRIDLIVINSAGAKAVRAGTPAAAPKPPARTANDVVIGAVYVAANDTAIGTTEITDMRVFPHLPVIIARTTTPVVFNTTTAEQTYFTVTLPSGLFTTGRILRVRCGGNNLINSGTPIYTFAATFGATVMCKDPMVVGAVDADRGSWWVDLNLVAQSNTDQNLTGAITISPPIAKTAPTNGRGFNLAGGAVGSRNVTSPMDGSAAIDADAADVAFAVKWTMDVSNVADEITLQYATAELL